MNHPPDINLNKPVLPDDVKGEAVLVPIDAGRLRGGYCQEIEFVNVCKLISPVPGQRLRAFRKHKRWTVGDMANRCSLSKEDVISAENQPWKAPLRNLSIMCTALNLKINDLLEDIAESV